MSGAKADEVALCVSTPRVTGADVPEELFANILGHVVNGWIRSLPSRDDPHIHTLTSLTLVCRYFANICRPRLYRNVTLRSRRHLEGLVGLLRSGCTPFGKFLLEFTQSFEMDDVRESKTKGVADNFKRKDLSWICQLGTILSPMLKNTEIDIQLRLHTNLPLLQLPRTVPPSTFQHVRKLYLQDVHFQRGDDLLRCVLFFRNLDDVRFYSCSYEPVTPPTAIFCPSRANHPLPRISLRNSDTLFPLVITELLAYYAQKTSIAVLSRGHEEARILTDIMSVLNGEFGFLNLIWKTDPESIFGHVFADASSNSPIRTPWAYFENLDATHYDILLSIPTFYDSADGGPMIRAWRKVASSIAHLSHLNTLKWSFKSKREMENFVKAVHPTLRGLNAAGKTMKFGGEDRWPGGPSKWESTSTILEHYPPDPEVEAPAEDQETKVTEEETEGDSGTETDHSTEPIESAGTPADDAVMAAVAAGPMNPFYSFDPYRFLF